MIDFIDPALRPSRKKKIVKLYSFKAFATIILALLAIATIAYVAYIQIFATLDTRPKNTIQVDKRIEDIKFNGRIDPIQTFPTTENSGNR